MDTIYTKLTKPLRTHTLCHSFFDFSHRFYPVIVNSCCSLFHDKFLNSWQKCENASAQSHTHSRENEWGRTTKNSSQLFVCRILMYLVKGLPYDEFLFVSNVQCKKRDVTMSTQTLASNNNGKEKTRRRGRRRKQTDKQENIVFH